MGQQYEADKIIQLLQFCSWKAHTTMNYSGLTELTLKLGKLPGSEEKYPNEKYLVDLMSEAKSAVKHDNIISKRKSYVDLLLNYAGYGSWKDWKNNIYTSKEYVQNRSSALSPLNQLKIAVWIPESLGRHLRSLLNQIQKFSSYSLDQIVYNDELPIALPKELTIFEAYDIIIWAIPTSWLDKAKQMTAPNWQEFVKSTNLIPVWIDAANTWETDPPFIDFIKQQETIGGIPGLLCSLLLISELCQNLQKTNESEVNTPRLPSNIQHFHDNSSGFITQGNIQNQNNTIQTITNYHSKNESPS